MFRGARDSNRLDSAIALGTINRNYLQGVGVLWSSFVIVFEKYLNIFCFKHFEYFEFLNLRSHVSQFFDY